MRAVAFMLGAVVPLAMLGCVGAESEADEPEEAVGVDAAAVTYVSPEPHGRGLIARALGSQMFGACARGKVPCVVESTR